MSSTSDPLRGPWRDRGRDPGLVVLESGVAALLVLAPWPLGGIGPHGRLSLEIGSAILLIVWAARALRRTTPLPSRWTRIGCFGLLALAVFQFLPLGTTIVGRLSPQAAKLIADSRPTGAALAAEERLLSADLSAFDPRAALSLDAPQTASAARSGASLVALLLVACTVAARRGGRAFAVGLIVGGTFQALWGLLSLAAGHRRIWHLPKQYFFDSATGTFVNPNHFAVYLAMSLACGAALARAELAASGGRLSWRWISSRGGFRFLLVAVCSTLLLSGLLLSFSRAGILIGLLAALFVIGVRGSLLARTGRLLAIGLVVVAAAIPLAQLGADRFLAKYERLADDAIAAGSRATVWRDSVELMGQFPLTGTGYGSFGVAYPLARSPEVRAFFAHAHNELLQSLVEGGALGFSLLTLLALGLGPRLLQALAGRAGLTGLGLAAALAAALLHSLVDFDLRIPALATTIAILAGAIEGLGRRAP